MVAASSDDYNDDFITQFELHQELIDKAIIRRYDFDSRTSNIIIELNHVYNDKRVSIGIKDYPDVFKLRNALKKFLVKEKDIEEGHAKLLAEVIDNNSNMLDNAYYAYNKTDKTKSETKEEGEGEGGGRQPSEAEIILDILRDNSNSSPLIHELFQDQYSITAVSNTELLTLKFDFSAIISRILCCPSFKIIVQNQA